MNKKRKSSHDGRSGQDTECTKKLQLAFSERRIRKGIYRMYARLRPYHLIGAIGGFLTALTAIISLAVSTSYYISAEWVIIVNMLLIGSNGLIATYFFWRVQRFPVTASSK